MKALTWDDDITDDRRDELVEKLAGKVVKHGMSIPAVLFLEMHKPFSFLASQSVILASGFLAPFVGIQNVQEYSKLIENRDNIDLIIKRVETLADNAKRNRNNPARESD